MATFTPQDAAIDLCMDATDAYLEQHRNMCQRLKDVRHFHQATTISHASYSPSSSVVQAIFLMTRCRRDLNLSAMPVDMMIPQDLQPLLSIRLATLAPFAMLCILTPRCFRTECSSDGSGAVFSLEKCREETKDTDPCHWFASLPSQELRRARGLFVDAVQFAVAAANSSMIIHAALKQLPDE
jgi:hypothetical protein